MAERVKTARQRTPSSTKWLARQLNDPYVQRARREGFRSRAAYKLMELDRRFHLLRPGARVVDLGAAPGGWTQVAVAAVKAPARGRVVALDLAPMQPVAGAHILTLDFWAREGPAAIAAALEGKADLVLSDMAAPATGHAGTDHLRIVALAEAAHEFARTVLAPGGAFVVKLYQGGAEAQFFAALKRDFATVRHAKPPASRADSAELYVVAQGFRAA
jgi:23S rRNA (uridine2552-2'-O)-methyltransferase